MKKYITLNMYVFKKVSKIIVNGTEKRDESRNLRCGSHFLLQINL
nr:hypothetical protein [Mycoplasmopsis gallinacea]